MHFIFQRFFYELFTIVLAQYVLAFLVPAAASWSETAWVDMTRLIKEKLYRKQNVNAQQEALECRRVLRPSQAVSSLKSSFPPPLPFKLSLIPSFPPWQGAFKAFSLTKWHCSYVIWAATSRREGTDYNKSRTYFSPFMSIDLYIHSS